jgi:filamentous hemagglutinin family protein
LKNNKNFDGVLKSLTKKGEVAIANQEGISFLQPAGLNVIHTE